jgi:hypothetical protein
MSALCPEKVFVLLGISWNWRAPQFTRDYA